MALQPILTRRNAHTVPIVAGPDSGKTLIMWPCIGVDYANEGAEDNPSVLTYANIVDDSHTLSTSLGDKIVAALPCSFEGVLGLAGGQGLPQFRRFITVQST